MERPLDQSLLMKQEELKWPIKTITKRLTDYQSEIINNLS